MNYTVIVLLITLCIFLYIKYRNKKMTSYTRDYYTIKVKELKDVPNWLRSYDEISIEKITVTTHQELYNQEKHDYRLSLNSYCDDDYD